jgi:hypothetical protein
MECTDESAILAGKERIQWLKGNSPMLEAQISDAFASVDTRNGAGEKGGESQYGLKEWSAVTEIVKIKLHGHGNVLD